MMIDQDLIHLILSVTLSFIIGLEVKTYAKQFQIEIKHYFFGGARTYTFIGILGFILYVIDPTTLVVYAIGFLALTFLYGLLYLKNIADHQNSILLYLVAIGVYTFGPLTAIYPIWMPTLVFVLMIFTLNAKQFVHKLSLHVNTYEFETFSKMILLSIVILPLLPNKEIIPYVPLSPFKIWMAVTIISAISYSGYIVQKYFFPSKGFFLTGLIGGTYSSTATTVVLAKKAKNLTYNPIMTASILVATAMMYLRLIVVAYIFNATIAKSITIPFVGFALFGFILSFIYLRLSATTHATADIVDTNPLELSAAFIFAALFIVMIVGTQFVSQHYGSGGLKVLSFMVGFTDIDPFILSLLTGKYTITHQEIFSAIVISAGSNNILKAFYALWFGGWQKTWHTVSWLLFFGVATILVGIIV